MVLSDYRKGVVTPAVIGAVAAAAATRGIPVLVDPKLPHAERYRGATLVTPNHHEAELMTAITIRTPDDARRAARQIHERTGANVVITWGEHGMWLLDASATPPHEEGLAASAREVADVTGAGDTVLALLALSLAAGASLADAARLANIAAGLVVARFGPAVVGVSELAAAIGDPAH
jgi:D-beta-D-heptose 7-phosphate kinase/D-beta-D-heptose 1-phosphate adenosyltransferase